MPSTDAAPNNGMQATAYSLRLAVLGSGFPPRLMPSVRLLQEHTGQASERNMTCACS
jgi:hypothetical protein